MENVLLFLFILSPVIVIFGVLKAHNWDWDQPSSGSFINSEGNFVEYRNGIPYDITTGLPTNL